MVTPLYLAALFIDKGNLLEKPILKKKITSIKLGKEEYPIFISNLLAAGVFLLTGVAMIYLTLSGKLSMGAAEREISRQINQVAWRVTEASKGMRWINGVFALISGYLLYKLIDRGLGK